MTDVGTCAWTLFSAQATVSSVVGKCVETVSLGRFFELAEDVTKRALGRVRTVLDPLVQSTVACHVSRVMPVARRRSPMIFIAQISGGMTISWMNTFTPLPLVRSMLFAWSMQLVSGLVSLV